MIPLGFSVFEDVQDVLAGEGFEVELVGGVVVGGNGFRVGIDHDRFVIFFPQGEGSVDAAVVEFDALADAVGTAAQDDDLGAVRRPGFVFGFVGGIVVGRVGFEFRRTGVHQLVDGLDAVLDTLLPDRFLVGSGQSAARRMSENPQALAKRSCSGSSRKPAPERLPDGRFHLEDLLDVVQKPGIDLGQPVDLSTDRPSFKRFADLKEALGIGAAQALLELLRGSRRSRWRADPRTHTGRFPGSGWPSAGLP